MSILKAKSIRIKRIATVTNTNGKLVRSGEEYFFIKANIQPERDISYIRETFGAHIESAIKCYSTSELLLRKDFIEYDSKWYEVTDIRHYQDIIPHYKIIAILVKDATRYA